MTRILLLRLQRIGFGLFIALMSPSVLANEEPYSCPQRVSVIDGNEAAKEIVGKVVAVYRELGCQTRFVFSPGRRNLVEFNEGVSDGELMRLRMVESEYTRAFARSGGSLRRVRRGLWAHPDQATTAGMPVGYQLGVVWQQRYADILDNTMRFYDSQSMMQAYAKHQLRGFLSAYTDPQEFVRLNAIEPEPVLEVALEPLEVFHYLAAEFEPFMKRFSDRYQALYP